MNEGVRALESATVVLLVDWPNAGVPRPILEAGRMVYGYSPAGYSIAKLVSARPEPNETRKVFPPDENEEGYLVFERVAARPARVDLVMVFRPEQELARILEEHVLPMGARTVWLLSAASSGVVREIREKYRVQAIENCDVIAAARAVRGRRS